MKVERQPTRLIASINITFDAFKKVPQEDGTFKDEPISAALVFEYNNDGLTCWPKEQFFDFSPEQKLKSLAEACKILDEEVVIELIESKFLRADYLDG